MNEVKVYDRASQFFHWLLASLIFFLVFYHPSTEEGHAEPTAMEINIHATVGLLVLLLVIGRIIWRTTNASVPAAPANIPGWQTKARTLAHTTLYIFMLSAPVVGIVLSFATELSVRLFGAVEIPRLLGESIPFDLTRSLHGFSADVLLYVAVLHLLVALYHQCNLKDGLLERMYKGD